MERQSYKQEEGATGSLWDPQNGNNSLNGQKRGKIASFCFYHGRIKKVDTSIFHEDRL